MRYDLDGIRHTNSLVDVASRYGVKLKKDGREWKGCCPFHNEKTPSFTIFTNGGAERFHCFGCGADGDVIAFVMQIESRTLPEACEKLNGKPMGGEVVPYKPKAVVVEADDYADLQVGSSDIVPKAGVKIKLWNPKRQHYGAFFPTHVWSYPGHGYVVRRNTPTGKEYSSIRVSQHGWTRWPFDRPRPLYGRLEGKGNVIIVEGEKACDALMAMKPSWRVVTWPGGTSSVQYADWRPLAGDTAVLWADHDAAGSKCMAKLQGILAELGCPSRVVDTFACTPDLHELGWDVADLKGDPAAYIREQLAKPVDVIAEAERQDEVSIQGLAPTSLEDIQRAHEAIKETEGKPKQNESAMITKVTGMTNMEAFVIYNEFAEKIILMKPIPSKARKAPENFKPTLLTAEHDLQFLLFLQENGFPGATILKAQHVIAAIAYRHRFHPVRDYLESLTWDGELRIHHWLETALHAERLTIEQDRYVQAVSRCSLIAAVARIFKPGCKSDSMLIFESPEGQRKSSAIRALCPNPDWFSESLPAITPHTIKDVQEHMLGVWLIEMPELTAMRKAEIEQLKAFLTTTVDRFRIPWGTRTGDHPRQCSFFGTTNSSDYLARTDGNRRFWPIKVGDVDVKWIETNRDQLWAEAAVAYLSGEDWWLAPDVEIIAKEEQKSRRQAEPWEALVEGIVAGMPTPITMESIFEGLVIPVKDRTGAMEHRIGSILKEIGWTVKQISIRGQRRNRWFPKGPHLHVVEDDE